MCRLPRPPKATIPDCRRKRSVCSGRPAICTASDLRRLNTQVPLDVLRTVVDLATEIGREGREGKPVGTMFVVGDTKKVLTMSRPLNFNPFRGYSAEERDVRDKRVREAIKDL